MLAQRARVAGALAAHRGVWLQPRRAISTVVELEARVLAVDQSDDVGQRRELEAALLADCVPKRTERAEADMQWVEFALEHEPTSVPLAMLRARLTDAGDGRPADTEENHDKDAFIFYCATAHPVLSLEVMMRPLLLDAVTQLSDTDGVGFVAAAARLPGLCKWIADTKAWEREDLQQRLGESWTEEIPESVQAIALGQPRPGHSVLGQGTFTAARPGFELLALEYATTTDDTDAELVRFYRDVIEAQPRHVLWLHDRSPEGLKESGGCIVSFEL